MKKIVFLLDYRFSGGYYENKRSRVGPASFNSWVVF